MSTLAMMKMEKNFVAVIEKKYPRRPYEAFDMEFLRMRLIEEVNELNEALKFYIENKRIEAMTFGSAQRAKLECADVSNLIDYIFEKLS
jgi:NTP pyrophosphatase (non-canonical NTP hydrolase)